ncbi:la-related protein 6C [Senna tora]|uniref:peroxidase n=1 Tax=Senna tora TaxID=362788 RepID=A0A834W9T7_9FABA|nr:la-related protein 6C [Senna tora]
MSQAQPLPEEKKNSNNNIQETTSSTTPNPSFKLNAQAPEFVPRSHAQMPISGYFYPFFQILGGAGASDWFYVGDQDPSSCLISTNNVALPTCSKNVLTHDLQQKIVKQVEYQFSDMSLLANESFLKQMNKDPEGYVPISIIASTKKVKSLTRNIHLLTQALRSSSKLVLSADGKKVKRKIPFTDKEKEELQSRTVVVENLPEDHSHENLLKIFSVVGSVKTIRICHPQESNSPRPKGDLFISNKIHALVEYETPYIAEKAVEKLKDDRNWRKGMRVRLLLRCSPRSVLKSKRLEFDGFLEDNEILNSESAEDSSHPNNTDYLVLQTNIEENGALGLKKGWGRGRGGKGRGRGLLALPCQPSSPVVGCDGSVLLDDTEEMKGEKNAGPNRNSLRGFEVIDSIKAELEAYCPSTVSCADILALAARDAVLLAGGPFWGVGLGRPDSLTASEDAANQQIPSPFEPLPNITAKFTSKGLDLKDVVVLSGGHTIGFAQCFTFKGRLFNFQGTGRADPALSSNTKLLSNLRSMCPDQDASDTNLAPLDGATTFKFDNAYYANLLGNSGLLLSDHALVSDSATLPLVRYYTNNRFAFNNDFSASMLKLSSLGVLTGHNNGQIRLKCGSVN